MCWFGLQKELISAASLNPSKWISLHIKSRIMYVSGLTLLAFMTFGTIFAGAWTTTSLTTTLAPPTCITPGCVVGTSVTDTAKITATPESCVPTTACNYGTVKFQVFHSVVGACKSTGSAISGFGVSASSTVNVPSTLAGGSTQVISGSFSTAGLPPGNYAWIVNYVSGGGSNSWPSHGPTCELMILTAPSHGVPEFPLASIGMIAMLTLMFSALLLLRLKFTRALLQ
jgi:hypothetical protein